MEQNLNKNYPQISTLDLKSYNEFVTSIKDSIPKHSGQTIELKSIPKSTRTDTSSEIERSKVKLNFVGSSVEYLTQDWSVINFDHTIDLSKLQDDGIPKVDLVNEVDLNIEKTPSGNESKILDIEENHKDLEYKASLFQYFRMPKPLSVSSRPKASPYVERLGSEIAVEVKEFGFNIEPIEPFFCTLSLYDYSKERKISEDFHFEMNTEDQLNLVGLEDQPFKKFKKALKAIFRLSPTSQNNSIYIVLIVSKILYGDIEEQHELYSKPNFKAKDVQKIIENCKRQQFRQNFVWSARPITDENGKPINGTLRFDFYKMKNNDVIGLIDDLRKEDKKLKTIPGHCDILVTSKVKQGEFNNRVSPSYTPIHPFDNKQEVTKEVQEFTSTLEYPYPYVSYVNNFYFYLQKIDVSSLPSVQGSSNRNIAVEFKLLDNDDDPDQEGLANFYDHNYSSGKLYKSYMSSVWYHTMTPKFIDEVSMKLPTQVHSKHHLLLNIYHVHVSQKKGGKNDVTHVRIGRAFIPLLKDDSIIRQKHVVRIALDLSPGYLTKPEAVEWADKKVNVTFYTRVISSIYSIDKNVHRFLTTYDWNQETEWLNIVNAMNGLFDQETNQRQIVRFIVMIMKTLIKHISSDNHALSEQAFINLLKIVDTISTLTNKDDNILEAYVLYAFQSEPNKTVVYNSLIRQWCVMIQGNTSYDEDDTNDELRTLWLRNSWFIFGLISKSLGYTYLNDKEQKKNVFGSEFTRNISNFISACGEFVRDHLKNVKYILDIYHFNIQIGHFFCDLLRLLDRSQTIELIFNYFNKLNQPITEAFILKCIMIKTFMEDSIFNYANLPVCYTFNNPREILKTWIGRHFFTSLLLLQLELAYASKDENNRMLVLDTLCDALYILAYSDYEDSFKESIYYTYFPFIVMTVEKFDLIENFQREEKRKIYACFMAIISGMPISFLMSYWRRETEKRILTFFEIIKRSIEEFEWKGYVHHMRGMDNIQMSPNPLFHIHIEESIIHSVHKSKKGKDKKKMKPNQPQNKQVDQSKDNITASESSSFTKKSKADVVKDLIFADQVSYTAMATVINFLNHFGNAMEQRKIFESVFSTIVKLLKSNQTVTFLTALMKRLYVLVDTFGNMLFVKMNSIYGDLVCEILRRCNSVVQETRDMATTLYARLILTNYKKVKNIDRTRLQTTISITTIVGQHKDISYHNLIESLQVVKKYVVTKVFEPLIPKILDSLIESAKQIITNHQKILQYAYDPETIADLYYNLSKQLVDHPDERITWLENLARFHKEKENFEEYAQTKIVTAALVQGYLNALNRWETNMIISFHLVCPSIMKETTIGDIRSLKVLSEETCQSSIFSADGFAKLIKDAIRTLKEAGLYELCLNAYRMLLPIYFESENYKKQHECHIDLYDLTSKLTDQYILERRIFSNYYRVGFYGSKFGNDLNGLEFIYKEKNAVLLSEFTERLKKQYGDVFGEKNIELLPNTLKTVDTKELDPNKLYLRVCSVELYLTKEEQEKKKSNFKKHFGIEKFYTEQPFTKSGAAHGDIESQWLRRTIYHCEYAFPYLKKRIKVIKTEEIELSPIEYSLSLIEKKITFFEKEKEAEEPNPKTLQRELQGILLTQVNAGFSAIANAFLSKIETEVTKKKKQVALADALIVLEQHLSNAVERNKRFFGANSEDQKLLQTEFENGLNRFQNLLNSFEIIKKQKSQEAKPAIKKNMSDRKLISKSSTRDEMRPVEKIVAMTVTEKPVKPEPTESKEETTTTTTRTKKSKKSLNQIVVKTVTDDKVKTSKSSPVIISSDKKKSSSKSKVKLTNDKQKKKESKDGESLIKKKKTKKSLKSSKKDKSGSK